MDDIIKKKLYRHTEDVPADSWSVIEARIQGRQKSRGLLWTAIPIGLLLVLGGIFWMNRSQQIGANDDQLTSQSDHIVIDKTDQTPNVNVINENDAAQLSSSNGEDADDNSSINGQDVSSSIAKNDQNDIQTSSRDRSINLVENSRSAKNSELYGKSGEISQNQKNTDNYNQTKSTPIDGQDLTRLDQNDITINPSRNKPIINKDDNSVFHRQGSDLFTESPNEIDKSSGSVHGDVLKFTRVDRDRRTDRSLIDLNLLHKKDIHSISGPPIKISDRILKRLESPCLFGTGKDCYDFKKKGQPLIIYGEFTIGPDVVHRSLTSRTGEEGYLDLRENTEKMELSFSTALRGGLVTRSGLGLKTGIIYSQIHEQFNYQGMETRITSFNDGDIVRMVVESGTVKRTVYNTLRTVDLPLLVGYEMDMGRYILALYGGGAINLSFSQEGEILESGNNRAVLNSSEFDIFKNNAGASVLANVGLYYKLNDKMQMMFEPNIRYRLGAVTKNSYSIEQKYISFGLQVGLRLQLH